MPVRSRVLALLCFALLLPVAARAESSATGFDVRSFTCPIGGETFTQDVGYSSLVLVQFADGSWLGDTGIDAQIPECPDNGLVILPDYDAVATSQRMAYLAYTPAQSARLPELIASEAYRALRKRSRHERAQWLATALGMPASLRWKLLVRGSWATTDAADRMRLVKRIADEGSALVDAMDASDMEKRSERLLIANALRELGRFDDAQALLDAIFASLPGNAEHETPDDLSALADYASGLHDAISHRDDDRFPIALSSSKWVDRACRRNDMPPPYGPTTANAKAACDRRARERQARDEAFNDAMALRESPEALDRQCASTPEGQRSPGLQEACRLAQSDRDQKAGELLALEHPDRLAADCEATPAREREGALFFGCISYQTSLEFELATQLAADDEAYAIICADGTLPQDRAAFATMACSSAERERTDREVQALMADKARLDAICPGRSEYEGPIALMLACDQRSRDVHESEVVRLVEDRAAFAATCSQAPTTTGDEADRQRVLCDDARRRQARGAPVEAAPEPGPERGQAPESPQMRMHADDSGLTRAARASAVRVIAKAKAERTYPKRQPGDLY